MFGHSCIFFFCESLSTIRKCVVDNLSATAVVSLWLYENPVLV